jgi:hypothetical protein
VKFLVPPVNVRDSPAKDGVSPVTVGVSSVKRVVTLAKSLFSPATCSHLLAKVDLSPARAFFASERLLIVSANAVHSLAKSGSSPAISECASVRRI